MGASLREARITLRRSLPDVARELRIRHVYILAIEEGRFEDLPGIAYETGFLRAYGNYLGLDGAALADRLKSARDTTAGRGELQVFAPADEGHLPTRSILLLAALLAVAVYGVWYFIANTEGDPVERVAALPDRLASLLDGEPDSANDPPTAGSATQSAMRDPATPDPLPAPEPKTSDDENAGGGDSQETESGAVTAPTQTRSETSTPALVVPPAPPVESDPPGTEAARTVETTETNLTAPAPALAVPDNRSASLEQSPAAAEEAVTISRIVLRAVTDSWVEIRSDDQTLVYSGLLREGESYFVPDRKGLTMVTGNAGGLDILVDGKAIPRLGPPGAVKRDIDLDNLPSQPDR